MVYRVEYSLDGIRWEVLGSVTEGKGGVEDIGSARVSARYLRMVGLKGISAYSIREIEVYPW